MSHRNPWRGPDPTPVYHLSASLAAFAGKTVRIFSEQDDNGVAGRFPGGGPQIVIDVIHIH